MQGVDEPQGMVLLINLMPPRDRTGGVPAAAWLVSSVRIGYWRWRSRLKYNAKCYISNRKPEADHRSHFQERLVRSLRA